MLQLLLKMVAPPTPVYRQLPSANSLYQWMHFGSSLNFMLSEKRYSC